MNETPETPEKRGPGRPRLTPEPPPLPAAPAAATPRGVFMSPEDIARLSEKIAADVLAKVQDKGPDGQGSVTRATGAKPVFNHARIMREVVAPPARLSKLWRLSEATSTMDSDFAITLYHDRAVVPMPGQLDHNDRVPALILRFGPAPDHIQELGRSLKVPKYVMQCDMLMIRAIAIRPVDLDVEDYGFPPETAIRTGAYTLPQALLAFEKVQPLYKMGILTDAGFKAWAKASADRLENARLADIEQESAIASATDLAAKNGRALIDRMNRMAAHGEPVLTGGEVAMAGAGAARAPYVDKDEDFS